MEVGRMGRTREYDESKALSGAMEAFRRNGYAAVSIKDLEEATGLKGGSLYNSYGDKAGVFAAAFAYYNRVVVRARVDEYAPESEGLAGLHQLFLTLLDEPGGGAFGCLITNSAIEFGGGAAIPSEAATGLKILSDTFERRLKAGGHSRRGNHANSSRIAATRLLALYQGLLVLIRAGWDKRALKKMINDEFLQIRGH
jgi:TetR/AcrR family transcriptional regulator, transcriptional repressor for nem operon